MTDFLPETSGTAYAVLRSLFFFDRQATEVMDDKKNGPHPEGTGPPMLQSAIPKYFVLSKRFSGRFVSNSL